MILFAVGVAVGALLGVPAFVAITNWLALRDISRATREEQEKEMRSVRP